MTFASLLPVVLHGLLQNNGVENKSGHSVEKCL